MTQSSATSVALSIDGAYAALSVVMLLRTYSSGTANISEAPQEAAIVFPTLASMSLVVS